MKFRYNDRSTEDTVTVLNKIATDRQVPLRMHLSQIICLPQNPADMRVPAAHIPLVNSKPRAQCLQESAKPIASRIKYQTANINEASKVNLQTISDPHEDNKHEEQWRHRRFSPHC
jgi:hypothetical protein